MATKTKFCPHCNGEMKKGTLKAGSTDATIVIAGEPDGFLGVIPYTISQITARVCAECGYIDLHAQNVQDLLRMSDGDDHD